MNKFIENQTTVNFSETSEQDQLEVLIDMNTPEARFYMGYSDGAYDDEEPFYSQYADDPDYQAGYQYAVDFGNKLKRHALLVKKFYELKNKRLNK